MSSHFIQYQKRWLWCVVLAAFSMSLAYSFYFRIAPMVDARAYDNIALEIVRTGQYPADAINRPGPAYEYFLAAIYAVFGHSYSAVWIIQAILLAVAALLAFFISRAVFGSLWHPLIGLAAAAFVGFSPDLISVSSMLMTETLLIFLIAAAVFSFFRHLDSGQWRWLVSAAVFVSLAALTRGNVILLAAPILLFFFWEKKWREGAVFAAVLIFCLLPWTVHNYRVYGEIKPFNASAGILYVGNHPGATGELVIDYPMPPGVNPEAMSQLDFDNALGRAGAAFIRENPLEFINLSFWRASIYFSFARPFAFWPHLEGLWRIATVLASSLYSVLIFGLGIAGAVLALSRSAAPEGRSRPLALLGMLSTAPLTVLALIVETRYRFPAYPFLAVFAGFAVYCLFARREFFVREVKKIAAVAGLLVANAAFDVIRNFQRILERLF